MNGHGEVGGGLRRTALHDWHVTAGARMADFGGWSMPIDYPGGGVLKEHAAVRTAVGLFDVSHLGKLALTGPGAADAVNRVLTNDLGRIAPGQAQYTLLCQDDGGVVDDMVVYLRSADEVLVVPNAANAAAVAQAFADALPVGVRVEDRHDDLAVLAIQGPRSPDVLATVGLPGDHAYMSFVEATWRGVPVVVCRSGYTGEVGYELLPPAEVAVDLWEAVLAASDLPAPKPCGLGARDTLRTEMGYPLHGQDLTTDISPVQARLGWAVGWSKPEFKGRAALVTERAAGPTRLLRGIRSLDRGIPRAGMIVRDEAGESVVGRVTSGTFGPTAARGIGLALLSATVVEGATVTVDIRGRGSKHEVVRPPFVTSSTR